MNRWKIVTWILSLAGVAVGIAIAVTALSMAGVSLNVRAIDDMSRGQSTSSSASVSSGSLPTGGRLVIPSIDVNAGVVVVGVDGSGVMGTPSNGWDVGWYDFSAVPGQPGNSVMTGHVDYYDVGPAVFSRLRDLGPGDEVQVQMAEDGLVGYEVTQVDSYDAGSAPVDDIIGPTDDDVLTLITCDGWFNPAIREYDHRLVVRAERSS